MRTHLASVLMLASLGLAAPAHAVRIAEFDLDAVDTDRRFVGLELDAGNYRVSLRSGEYIAWSNFDTTSPDCTNDCAQGWLNFFGIYNVATDSGGFVENGAFTPFGEYDFAARLGFSTPEAALAAAEPYDFALDQATLFFFFIEDCEGCFVDNRGGLSFTLFKVPEPGTLGLMLLGFTAAGLAWRRGGAGSPD